MTPELTTIIGAIVGVILVIGAGMWWWVSRTPVVRRELGEELPLFGGLSSHDSETGADGIMAGGVVRQAGQTSSPVSATSYAPPSAASSAPDRSVKPLSTSEAPVTLNQPAEPPERPKPFIREFTTARSRTTPAGSTQPVASTPAPGDAHVVNSAGVPGTMIEGQMLRFSVPSEGTLQFLPGRLEIASGVDSGREIRFVSVPGPNGAEVTFGRSEGELYRHIQLRDQTVSRSHARLRMRSLQWHLLNFSRTNPVVHNGRVLGDQEEVPLDDGDRIEMGEVLFTFRSR